MKDLPHRLLLLFLIGMGTFILFQRVYLQKWRQHELALGQAMQSGILMQMAIDEFGKQVGRHPDYGEFTNVFGLIGSFHESVTPDRTNDVTETFDNSGGWFYDEKPGEIRLNCSNRYVIGLQTWVDPSKISFRAPASVEAVRFGRSKILDYSTFNQRLGSGGPQMADIIRKWVIANKAIVTSKP